MGREYLAHHKLTVMIEEEAFETLNWYIEKYPKRWDGEKLVSTTKSYVVEMAIQEYCFRNSEQTTPK